MWDKLLGLFKDTYSDQEVPASIAKREARRRELARQPIETPEENFSGDKGQLIGYNYLKGLDDEDDNHNPRKFINLAKLLRGDYKDGKIEANSTESESDLRRKNSK